MDLSDGLVRPSCGAAGAECLGGLTTHRSCVCREVQSPVARGEAENKVGHAVGQTDWLWKKNPKSVGRYSDPDAQQWPSPATLYSCPPLSPWWVWHVFLQCCLPLQSHKAPFQQLHPCLSPNLPLRVGHHGGNLSRKHPQAPKRCLVTGMLLSLSRICAVSVGRHWPRSLWTEKIEGSSLYPEGGHSL